MSNLINKAIFILPPGFGKSSTKNFGTVYSLIPLQNNAFQRLSSTTYNDKDLIVKTAVKHEPREAWESGESCPDYLSSGSFKNELPNNNVFTDPPFKFSFTQVVSTREPDPTAGLLASRLSNLQVGEFFTNRMTYSPTLTGTVVSFSGYLKAETMTKAWFVINDKICREIRFQDEQIVNGWLDMTSENYFDRLTKLANGWFRYEIVWKQSFSAQLVNFHLYTNPGGGGFTVNPQNSTLVIYGWQVTTTPTFTALQNNDATVPTVEADVLSFLVPIFDDNNRRPFYLAGHVKNQKTFTTTNINPISVYDINTPLTEYFIAFFNYDYVNDLFSILIQARLWQGDAIETFTVDLPGADVKFEIGIFRDEITVNYEGASSIVRHATASTEFKPGLTLNKLALFSAIKQTVGWNGKIKELICYEA